MCSIVMPADFRHSSPPLSHGYLQSRCDAHPPPRLAHFRKPATGKCVPRVCTPTRPILVVRPEPGDADLDSSSSSPGSPTRLKKKVVFADDRGMSLCHVRVMREPSNVPPIWSSRFLAQVTHNVVNTQQKQQQIIIYEPWLIAFAQPASDYVAFRKRLDADKVSLENVIVKTSEEVAAVVGTVKVCNLAFEKHVSLRMTVDDWRTHKDLPCAYLAGNVSAAAYVLHDTFSFTLPLPAASHRLEFCVRFSCNHCDYWDNNRGENYVVLKQSSGARSPENIFSTKVDTWSEFACWNQLDTTHSPYW